MLCMRKLVLSAVDRYQQKYGRQDPLMWTRDLAEHSCGQYSFAVVSTSNAREDRSELQPGSNALFVGVYDGHGGNEASSFLENRLFNKLMTEAGQQNDLNEETLERTINAMEEQFIEIVRNTKNDHPGIVNSGSCCLIGAIFRRRLHIANLGDSRAVLGYKQNGQLLASQLTHDHNVNQPAIRHEVMTAHPQDIAAVTVENGTYYIKSKIQISRSIGDANMKYEDCAEPDELPEVAHRPYLTSNPELVSRNLGRNDKFVVFASDGLWDLLNTEDVVKFVFTSPRNGVARRLITKAQKKAARRRENFTYDQLLDIPAAERRDYHDDITVVVVFIDYEKLGRRRAGFPATTVQGGTHVQDPAVSPFTEIEHLMDDQLPPNNN